LIKEFEDQKYFSVHHLTVPCYYLQQNIYSKEAWLIVRNLLYKFLYSGLKPETIKKEYHGIINKRDFNFTKGEKYIKVNKVEWSKTILDIHLEDANIYCKDIVEWGKSIIEDTKELV
jgi:hypothetical protein